MRSQKLMGWGTSRPCVPALFLIARRSSVFFSGPRSCCIKLFRVGLFFSSFSFSLLRTGGPGKLPTANKKKTGYRNGNKKQEAKWESLVGFPFCPFCHSWLWETLVSSRRRRKKMGKKMYPSMLGRVIAVEIWKSNLIHHELWFYHRLYDTPSQPTSTYSNCLDNCRKPILLHHEGTIRDMSNWRGYLQVHCMPWCFLSWLLKLVVASLWDSLPPTIERFGFGLMPVGKCLIIHSTFCILKTRT